MYRPRLLIVLSTVASMLVLAGCEYVRLLRPSVLKQLNPRVVRLVNELPEVEWGAVTATRTLRSRWS